MHRLLLLATLASGCTAGPDPVDGPDTDPDTDEASAVAPPPPLQRAVCGDPPAPLLDLIRGDLVDAQRRSDRDLPAALLNFAVSEAGVPLPPFPHDVRGATFRYTTQDRGQPVEATGLLLVPEDVDGPLHVALSLHFFHGVLPGCPPAEDDGKWVTAAILAAHGYAVVAPDFIGLSAGDVAQGTVHAPLVIEQVALGSWDALRAGRAALDGPLVDLLPDGGLSDRVVIWGASQGGHAALSTAHLQPWAAPEVDLAAVIALVPPSDLVGAFAGLSDETDLSERAGLAALTLWGMHRWYTPDASLSPLFTQTVVDGLAAAEAEGPLVCDEVDDPTAGTVTETFSADLLSAEAAGRLDTFDPAGCWLASNSLARNPNPHLSDAPTLLVYGEADDVVSAEVQSADLPALCDQGWRLTARTCTGTDHATTAFASLPDQLDFLQQALAGTPPEPDCTLPVPAPCAVEVPAEEP